MKVSPLKPEIGLDAIKQFLIKHQREISLAQTKYGGVYLALLHSVGGLLGDGYQVELETDLSEVVGSLKATSLDGALDLKERIRGVLKEQNINVFSSRGEWEEKLGF